MGVFAITVSAALGAAVYLAVASKPWTPVVDAPVEPEVWRFAELLYAHLIGLAVVLFGLGALLSGNITQEALLADLPSRADRRIVYSAYFMGAFYLALLAHMGWRHASATSKPPQD